MEVKFKGNILPDRAAEVWRYYGFHENVCPHDIEEAIAAADGEELVLLINSDGGSLVAGTEIYSLLKNYGGRVRAHVQSRSASAATVAMMAADEITAEPVSLICIHNPFTYAEGDSEEMRHVAEELDNIKEAIVNAYMPRLKISRDEVWALMSKNVWLDVKKAHEIGIVDSWGTGEDSSAGSEFSGEAEVLCTSMESSALRIINGVGVGSIFPTEKMVEEYRLAKESEVASRTSIESASRLGAEVEAKRKEDALELAKARAFLEIYR